MSDTIDTRITPSLHPRRVKEVDGYDDETALVLGQTETAFSEAYEGLRSIHDAKEAAMRDPRLNEAGALLKTDDYAEKVFGKITRAFDNELARLNKAINHIEGELSQPVESKASGSIAAEVRAHLKGLAPGERMSVLRQAIDSGDVVVATAALGAPAMLSGIDPATQATLTRMYHEKQNPTLAKRRTAMTAARKLIEENAGLVFKERDKAVGFVTDPKSKRKLYPAELRKMAADADKPFAKAS